MLPWGSRLVQRAPLVLALVRPPLRRRGVCVLPFPLLRFELEAPTFFLFALLPGRGFDFEALACLLPRGAALFLFALRPGPRFSFAALAVLRPRGAGAHPLPAGCLRPPLRLRARRVLLPRGAALFLFALFLAAERLRSSSSWRSSPLPLSDASFFVLALFLGAFRLEALAFVFLAAFLRLGFDRPFFLFALFLGGGLRLEALAFFFLAAFLAPPFFLLALFLGGGLGLEALALFFLVAFLRLGFDPASFFFLALFLGGGLGFEALALFFLAVFLRLGFDPALALFFLALFLGGGLGFEALALFLFGAALQPRVACDSSSRAAALALPPRGASVLRLTLALLLALTLGGGGFCLFRARFLPPVCARDPGDPCVLPRPDALTECLDARVCRRCRCGLDGWRTLDWL